MNNNSRTIVGLFLISIPFVGLGILSWLFLGWLSLIIPIIVVGSLTPIATGVILIFKD